jgi:hypothetical protein
MYIYQIEVSNICSLKCTYCPHPTQERSKGMMSFETFRKCVELYQICENKETLRLHNFGEALLHPELPAFIRYADDRGIKCSFFTNGLTMKKVPFSRQFWQNLADHGLETVDFSSHELETEEFEKIVGGVIKLGRVFNPRTRVLGTWAGQTGPPETPVPEPCIFERMNAVVVLWDGRISSCCLDVEGQVKGIQVDDLLRDKTYAFAPIRLCNTCSSMRHKESL